MVHSTKTFPDMTLEQILSNCLITDNGCHEWQGTTVKKYGVVYYRRKMIAVHRIVCFLTNGEPAENHQALHSCDNPTCVNPAHLRWGSQKENMMDCKQRNRQSNRSGEKNGRAKLDENKVKEIRSIYGNGLSMVQIAEMYGVSNQLISRIIKREAWSHVA